TTSACFPSIRRIWPQARAEPIASPSGRACDVSTKCLRCSICRRTSSSMILGSPFVIWSDALFGAAQQFLDPGFILLRTIKHEQQLRGAAQVQALCEFAPYVSGRCFQAFHRFCSLLAIACYNNQYLGRL